MAIDFKKRLKARFPKYTYVDTLEKVQELDEYLTEEDGTPKFELIAYDTETNGLSHKLNTVVGFSLSVNDHSGFYIPLLEWRPNKNSLKTRKIASVEVKSYMEGNLVSPWDGKVYPEFVRPENVDIPEFFSEILKRWLTHPDVSLLMHNAPFDCNMTHGTFGVELTNNLFCDTLLLKHFIDENSKNALKAVAELWKEELGFDPYKDAAMEQKELGQSVIINGGTFNSKTKHIWRADPKYMGKYAISDTFLTMKVFNEGMKRLEAEYKEKHFDLFFEKEIMPVCREVVIPMQREGAYIDLPHFQKLQKETIEKMTELEDNIQDMLSEELEDFSVGKSIEEEIGKKAYLQKIMDLEGLAMPTKYDKKTGTWKETLAKKEVQKAYEENPHWFWGYLLGEDEIKYSDKKIKGIKNEMYAEKTGRKYRFNIGSVFHLRWLFIDKLGNDPTLLPQTDSATKENPLPEMGADVLKEFFEDKYEFVKPLLLWKKLSKLLGTYITPAIELQIDSKLYMNFNQGGTKTGRFSCSGGYNLQTLPKVEEYDRCYACESENVTVKHSIELLADQTCHDCGNEVKDILCSSAIKKGFVAPKGYKIVNADFASQEVRCFAFCSNDPELKKIFKDDLDFYSKIYVDTMDEEGNYSADPKADNYLKKVNKKARDMIKPVCLGIPFGALGPQVANLMGFKTNKTNKETGLVEEVTDFERGRKYREAYLKAYPDLADYMMRMENEAVTKGWVENIVGRRRTLSIAPAVYKLLGKKGIDIETFISTGRKKLSHKSVIIQDMELTNEDLRELLKDMGYNTSEKLAKLHEKNKFNWAFVKAKFKNEIDVAKNYPIQSLAAHITNKSMLEVTRGFRHNGLKGARIFSVIHDEIACYVKESEVEKGSQELQKGMETNEFSKLLDIPMEAEPIVANTLKEAK